MRFFLPLLALALPACQQQMSKQPAYRPLVESAFFPDGRASRPVEAGTVHRAQLLDDDPMTSGLTAEGKKVKADSAKAGDPLAPAGAPPVGAPDKLANYVDAFPMELTPDDLARGQGRYTIYCTPCHGPLGDGHGKIWERGFLYPPDYHKDLSRGFDRYGVKVPLREVPVGYIYEVITRGYGGMASYSAQLSVADRWRVAAYVRTLQFSRGADLAKLPAAAQDAVKQAAGGSQ